MPAKNAPKLSAFGQTAVALDEELERFRQLTAAGAQVPLNSRRNLERAVRAVDEASASQERLGTLMQELVAALKDARGENERCAAGLEARNQAVQARLAQLKALVDRVARLASVAGEITRFVKTVGEQSKAGQSNAETVAALSEIELRMTGVVEEAQDLTRAAEADQFADLVTDIDALRQQVLAARNKTGLFRKQLLGGLPS